MIRCGTCGATHRHAPGCPDGDEPLGRPERDPDDILEERRERDMEREYDYQAELDRKADARERMIRAWRIKQPCAPSSASS